MNALVILIIGVAAIGIGYYYYAKPLDKGIIHPIPKKQRRRKCIWMVWISPPPTAMYCLDTSLNRSLHSVQSLGQL